MAGGIASQLTDWAHRSTVQCWVFTFQLYIPASAFSMLFVACEILLAKEKQTFYKNKIGEAIKSPAPYKHLKRQAAVMWRKLGSQGEGFWKKHTKPTRSGNARAPEQQWDTPRRVHLKFFCRCGSSHWMRTGVIIWNVAKEIFASYTSTVTGVCSCPMGVGLALGNEMLMSVAWAEVVGHALLDQRHLNKNNFPPVSAAWVPQEHTWGRPAPNWHLKQSLPAEPDSAGCQIYAHLYKCFL